MDKKTIDLNLNYEKPVYLEVSRGDILIDFSNSNTFIEYGYDLFGTLTPELIINETEKNNLIFKNSEIIETDVVLHLNEKIKALEVLIYNGNIIIKNIQNINLNLQTNNGMIKIDKCSGQCKAISFNGDIKCDKYTGYLNLKTINGSIKVINWESDGGLINTENGLLYIEFQKINKSIDINAKNGKISIGLSKKSPCTIIARGTEVISYINKIIGDRLGSPTKIDWEGGGVTINVISNTDKVYIGKIEDMDNIVPDIEKIFSEFEEKIKNSINFEFISDEFSKIGDKIESFFGKLFLKNIKENIFNKNIFKDNDNDNNKNQSNEKLEIIKLLKEGKITVEEAERLLKAIK